jgi:uncharacterized delta-60 repeat protein
MSAHSARHWIDRLFNREVRNPRKPANKPRPRLESLEDRTLLRAGPLDPTFGAGGTVQTNLPADADIQLMRSVRQADGKIVAAGTVAGLHGRDIALERFNTDGSLDTTFGRGGQVETPLLNDYYGFGVGLALQADGKIVVADTSLGQFITLRYNTDGSMDGSFGPGGYVLSTFSDGGEADAVAVQADGKIVVAGDEGAGGALVRYNPDGTLDATFGSGGKAIISAIGQNSDVALQADGKIVAAGTLSESIFGKVLPTGTLGLTSISGVVGFGYSETVALARYNTDGSADAGFGNNGVVTTPLTINFPGIVPFPSVGPSGRQVSEAVGSDGEIVVTDRASGGVARYNADGTIDAAFGVGGVATVADNADSTARVGNEAIAIDAAGRVVVGGFFGPAIDSATWFVARLRADGRPDDTFGNGGQVVSSFFPPMGNSDAEVTDLVLDPDGGVTAVGIGQELANFIPTIQRATSVALARYDVNGALEANFGTGGQELNQFQGPSQDSAAGVVVQPDGKVVAAIRLAPTGGGTELALVRYSTDGSLDTTFGSGGATRLAAGWVYGLALQADGKIVALITNLGFQNKVVRVNADGSLDTSFGTNSAVTLDFTSNSITVDANGGIVVGGHKFSAGTSSEKGVVARFLSNGSPDATFGGTGEVTTQFNQTSYYGFAIVAQADGKIILAGRVDGNAPTVSGIYGFIGLVRYNTDGSLDNSFGSSGIVTTAIGADSAATSLALEPDGRIVVGGEADNNYFLLVRYNKDGSLDTTFAQGGYAFSTDFTSVKGIAVQSDGTIVAVTTAYAGPGGVAVVSYAPDGRRDVTFTSPGPGASAAGVAVGPDGKVVIAGSSSDSGVSAVFVERFLNQPPPAPVFVVGTDGSLMAENYISAGWATLSPAGTILSISAVGDAGGGYDVFAIAIDHTLWERTINGWVEISSGFFQQISATTDASGNAVVFGVLGAGAGENADSLWEYRMGGWIELTGANLEFPTFVHAPGGVQYVSAIHTAQGEVAYVIASNGNRLFEYAKTIPGDWQEVSSGSFQQVSAGLNGAGQAVVYGVLSDGSLWEQDPAFGPVGKNSGWKNITGIPSVIVVPGIAAATLPTFNNPFGPTSFLSAAGGPDKVFAVAAGHSLWEYSNTSGWQELSGRSFTNTSARQTAAGADEVFATMTDGSLWEYSTGGAGPAFQELLPSGVASSSAP